MSLCFVRSFTFEGICGRKEDFHGLCPLNISNEVTKDLKTNVSGCLVFVSKYFTDEYYVVEMAVFIEMANLKMMFDLTLTSAA